MAISVTYYVVDGFPQSTWNSGEFVAVVKFWCAWDDRVTFIEEIGTYPDSQYGWGEGPSDALAREIEVRPWPKSRQKGSGTTPDYDWALVTVKYTTRGPRYSGGVLADEWLQPFSMYQRLDHRQLQWSDAAPVLPGDAPRKTFYGLEYVRKVYGADSIPAAAYNMAGYVNNNNVVSLFLGKTFGAGTLLWRPPSVHVRWNTAGAAKMDITYHMVWNPFLWNKHVRAKTGALDTIHDKNGTQVKLYPEGAFTF